MLELSFMASVALIFTAALTVHPLILCLALIGLATSVSLTSGLIFMKWISYAVILIFLGGMMVIFIYITTLAGNEKFYFKIPLTSYLVIVGGAFLIMYSFSWTSMFKKEFFMAHTYLFSSSPILWFLIIFLFSALITVVKMAESFKGALIKFM